MRGRADVIVVGAGIAGLACALTLARRGARVVVLEQRRRPGGRATSFQDATTGELLDNCQHVTLGCCERYLALLDALGAGASIAWHEKQWWVEAGGRRSVLEPSWLPGMLAHTPSFLRATFLTPQEKAAVALALGRLLVENREAHANRTFLDWLRSAGQPAEAIDKFWEPVVISACNLSSERVCARTAMHVFQGGLLAGRRASRIGVPTVPLVNLYHAAGGLLAQAGGELILGEASEGVSARIVRTRAGDWHAGAVVCATPFEKVPGLLADESDPRVRAIEGMSHSPILGVHLTFDAPVLDVPHAVLVGRPTQWLFRKDGGGVGEEGELGSRMHAVISGADDWMDLSEEEIAARVCADVRACFPESRGAALRRVRAVKERRATFAATCACEAARPAVVGPKGLDGVLLAGDYVRTGWPATMEGATIAGEMAACALLGSEKSST